MSIVGVEIDCLNIGGFFWGFLIMSFTERVT